MPKCFEQAHLLTDRAVGTKIYCWKNGADSLCLLETRYKNIPLSFCIDKCVQFYIRWTNLTTMPINKLGLSFKSKIVDELQYTGNLKKKICKHDEKSQ